MSNTVVTIEDKDWSCVVKNELDKISYDIENFDVFDSMIITRLENILGVDSKNAETFKQIKNYKSINYDKLSLLHNASKNLRNTLCNYLINKIYIDVNIRSKNMLTPLHTLMKSQISEKTEVKMIKTFEVLIENKAYYNALDVSNLSVLDYAIMNNNYTCVKLLLNLKDICLKAENMFVPSPFHIACKLGNDKIIQAILKVIETENLIETYNGNMAIHFLVDNKEEKLETTREILEKLSHGKHFFLYHTILNSRSEKKYSLLQIAIQNGHLNIVDMILKDYYPKDFCPDGNGNRPIHLAACNGSLELLKIIVKNDAISFSGNNQADNPLHLAALKNKPEFIASFLKLEADYISKNETDKDLTPCVRERNNSGQTPLFSAVDVNSEKSVEALLNSTDIEEYCVNSEGDTIVHVCSKLNNVESLRYLLKKDKFFDSPFFQNIVKETALHIAARLGHLEIIKLIIKVLNKGTDENKKSCFTLKNNLGQTCFHLACLNNKINVVEYLISDLKLLFLVELNDEAGNSGMHLAAMNGNHSIMDLILQTNVDSKAILVTRNHEGLTPLEISLSKKFFQASKICINAMVEKIETENNSVNLLHVAVINNAYELVELLLEKQVPINSTDAQMKNALDLAIENEKKECIRVLLKNPEWKKLFQHQRPVAYQSDFKIGFLQIVKFVDHLENPQLFNIYKNEYWDIFHIILENSKIDEDIYDLEVLNPPLNSIDKHPLMLMIKSGQQLLIKHESTRALTHLKWAVIPRLIFYSQLFFNLLFILFFALYSNELTELNFANFETESSINTIDEIWLDYGYVSNYEYMLVPMLFIMCVIMIIKVGLFGLIQSLSISSFLEAVLIFLCYMAIYSENMSNKVHYTSLAIFVMFVNFTRILKKVPKFGIYVLAFERTIINSARFIPMTILTYSAFLLAFRVRSDSNAMTVFTNLTTADSLIKGLTMVLGEFKTDEMGIKDSQINYSLYILFIGIMSVIILNLLVGIAVGELSQTLEQADVQFISMRIRFCLQVQNSLKLFTRFRAFDKLYKSMDQSHYNKSIHRNKLVVIYKKLESLFGMNREPEIVLDDPQTRLDNAILNLSVKTDKNFKIITETIDKNIFEVNEKLKGSKQRLEDCLVELSRRTDTNFESSAVESNDALESVETKLTKILVNVSNNVIAIESLLVSNIRSSRQSIIDHLRHTNLLIIKNFRIVFEKMNIAKSVEEGSQRREHDFESQKQFKDIINLFNALNKKVDKIESALSNLYKNNLKNQEEILSILNQKAVKENERETPVLANSDEKTVPIMPYKVIDKKTPKIEEKLPKIADKIDLFSSSDLSKINIITEENNKIRKKSLIGEDISQNLYLPAFLHIHN